jgi:hypothetical protein
MSEIKQLLDRTARSVDVTPSPETVDADVRRGRAALGRRRRGRVIRLSIVGTVAAALVAPTILAANQGFGPSRGTPIRLVAYHGEQLEGFIVDQVPDGWYLQGSNTFRLTIAPQGDTSSPDSFIGKLVVMLLSSSAPQELPEGEPVKVGDYDGVVTHTPEAETLTYEDGAGHLVQVQAWRSTLAWTNEQLARFGEGVRVTADAQAGVG